MSRFTNDTFEESSKTTIGVAFATKNMAVETSNDSTKDCKKQVKLQVWDTGTPLLHHHYSRLLNLIRQSRDFSTSAGQERYRALSSAYVILTKTLLQGSMRVHAVPVPNDDPQILPRSPGCFGCVRYHVSGVIGLHSQMA